MTARVAPTVGVAVGTASGTGAATQAQLPQAQLPQAQLPQAQLERARLARRGRWLTAATLGYNSLEGVIAVGAGLAAGSVALVGFGADSAIEVSAALVAFWRLRAERVADPTGRARAERTALRLVGVSFLSLAAYIAVDAAAALRRREVPELTRVGLLLTACSIVVMPLLARAKRRVAGALASGALAAEATRRSSARTSPPSCSPGSPSTRCSGGGGPTRWRRSRWCRSSRARGCTACAGAVAARAARRWAPRR